MKKQIANTTAVLLMLAVTGMSTNASANTLIGQGDLGTPVYTCTYNIHGEMHEIEVAGEDTPCPAWVDDQHQGVGKDTIEECTSAVSRRLTKFTDLGSIWGV